MIKIEKEKYPSTTEIGISNAKFYGYVINDYKRIGTVWKFNDGHYVMNEDFNRYVHSHNNRPVQVVAKTLKELKAKLSMVFE